MKTLFKFFTLRGIIIKNHLSIHDKKAGTPCSENDAGAGGYSS